MVVLTDGEIFEDPLDLTTVISSPKMQGVERFAIGVRARSRGTPPDPVRPGPGGQEVGFSVGLLQAASPNPVLITNTPQLLSSQSSCPMCHPCP